MEYRTIYAGGEGEMMEKKSRFIATVKPVKTEEEAEVFIDSMKKKYWNASHNCFAYILGPSGGIQRCSDDGEPSGTAGRPMLNVLLGEGLRDTAVVVTRYFGGTLLGTGGLVRAYSAAVKEGLSSSIIITKIPGVKLKIGTEYTELGKVQYILGQRGLKILDSIYEERVVTEVMVPTDMLSQVKSELTEGTSGRAELIDGEECYYADIEGTIKILED